jgi:two-component system chemotaxis response regulator CheB
MPVWLGKENIEVKPGNIYIAPGENHMVIDENELKVKLLDSPPQNYVKPAADPMFRSIATSFGEKSIGIILTGRGQDGSIGAGYIFYAGGKVIVQDPEDSIMSSMPKSVIQLDLADRVIPVQDIPNALDNIVNSTSHLSSVLK